MEYPIIVWRLSEEDGGGYMGLAPDLMGCMGDGETPEAALADAQSAVLEWLDTAKDRGLAIPAPHSKAHAAQQEREALLDAVKNLTASMNDLDGRYDELARRVAEIEERIENLDKWDRFISVTGYAIDAPLLPYPLNH